MPFVQSSAAAAPPARAVLQPRIGPAVAPTPAAGPAPTRAERFVRWAVVGMVVFAVLAAASMLSWPLGYDQSIFAQNGAVVLNGGAPYRDAFETRGPVAFYLFAAVEAVFGRSAFAIRFFDVLLLAAADLLLWRVVRPFASRRHATVAVALWTLYVVSWTYNDTAEPDLWAGYAMVVAAVLGAREGGARARDLVLAGVLVGLCALTKPFYAAFLAVPAVAVAVREGWVSRPTVRACLLLVVGAAIPTAVVLAALWAKGALPAMIDVHVLFNTRVYAAPPASALVKPLGFAGRVRQIFEFPRYHAEIALALAPAAVGVSVLWRRQRGLAAGLVAIVALGAVCVALQGKFFFYHWEILLLALAVCAAVGLSRVAGDGGPAEDAAPPRSVRTLVAVTVGMLLLAVGVSPAEYVKRWLAFAGGRMSGDVYYGTFDASKDINPADQMQAAAFLRANTAPGTPVAIWGVDAAIPFLAGRPGASRFPMTRYFAYNPDAPMVRAYRHEYADSLRAKRPPYFINGLYADRFYKRATTPIVVQWPEIGRFLDDEYVLDRRIGDLDVYRRRDYQPPASAPAPGRP